MLLEDPAPAGRYNASRKSGSKIEKNEHRTSNSPQASKHLSAGSVEDLSASGRSNAERSKMKKVAYDLEERLLEYSVRINKGC